MNSTLGCISWRHVKLTRDLERRLDSAEARQLVSQRVAAILRMIDAMSEEELLDQMAAPSGIFDPRTMTDAELDCLIAEFEVRATGRLAVG